MEEGRFEGNDEFFVHPVRDALVMAGNGTIGLEIIDELAEPDAVVVPVGGGGLLCGIASAVKVASPRTRIVAVEPETAAPLAASLAAGAPTEIAYEPSFVDGAGGRSILPGMWPLLQEVVDQAVTVSLEETARAVRLLLEHAKSGGGRGRRPGYGRRTGRPSGLGSRGVHRVGRQHRHARARAHRWRGHPVA